jgi:hypothetical protein
MREIAKERAPDQRIVVYALAIFLCVFLGPFETGEDLEFWDRVAFWTVGVSTVGFFIEVCVLTALQSSWLSRAPLVFQLAIGSGIGSVPGASFMIALNRVFRPEHLSDMNFPILWLQVTIMSILISGMEIMIWSRFRTSPNPSSIAPISTTTSDLESIPTPTDPSLQTFKTSRLKMRLPARLREGQIISVSMQDHYAEITTTLGNDMILMRLSDAIDLLDGKPGVQTHRSHWAARSHAESLTKVARRHELRLSDGRSLPVSNSYKEAVKGMLNEKGQT